MLGKPVFMVYGKTKRYTYGIIEKINNLRL